MTLVIVYTRVIFVGIWLHLLRSDMHLWQKYVHLCAHMPQGTGLSDINLLSIAVRTCRLVQLFNLMSLYAIWRKLGIIILHSKLLILVDTHEGDLNVTPTVIKWTKKYNGSLNLMIRNRSKWIWLIDWLYYMFLKHIWSANTYVKGKCIQLSMLCIFSFLVLHSWAFEQTLVSGDIDTRW